NGLKDQDAADLVQDVLTALVQKLPEFTYDRQKSFRSWLFTITYNKCRDLRRRRAAQAVEVGDVGLQHLAGPGGLDEFEEAEYLARLLGTRRQRPLRRRGRRRVGHQRGRRLRRQVARPQPVAAGSARPARLSGRQAAIFL